MASNNKMSLSSASTCSRPFWAQTQKLILGSYLSHCPERKMLKNNVRICTQHRHDIKTAVKPAIHPPTPTPPPPHPFPVKSHRLL